MSNTNERLEQAWARASWVRRHHCEPPHEVVDEAKLAALVEAFSDGEWDEECPPLVGFRDGDEAIQLLSGSHRYAATSKWDELPVVLLDEDEWDSLYEALRDDPYFDSCITLRDSETHARALAEAGHELVAWLVADEDWQEVA